MIFSSYFFLISLSSTVSAHSNASAFWLCSVSSMCASVVGNGLHHDQILCATTDIRYETSVPVSITFSMMLALSVAQIFRYIDIPRPSSSYPLPWHRVLDLSLVEHNGASRQHQVLRIVHGLPGKGNPKDAWAESHGVRRSSKLHRKRAALYTVSTPCELRIHFFRKGLLGWQALSALPLWWALSSCCLYATSLSLSASQTIN